MAKERVLYLDGLRGIAAVVVVVHHMMIGFYPATYTRGTTSLHTGRAWEWLTHDTPLGIGINGGFAVAIFLLLSGYVLFLGKDRKKEPDYVASSIVSRYFRFALPILVTSLVAWLLILVGWNWNLAASQITGSNWWLGVQWLMQPSFWEATRQGFLSLFEMYTLSAVYNSSAWTMPFFFLGPTFLSIYLLLTQQWRKRDLLLIVAMGFLFKSHYWLILVGYSMGYIGQFSVKKFIIPIQIGLVGLVLWLGNYPQTYDSAAHASFYHFLPILSFVHTSAFYQGLGAMALLLLLVISPGIQRLLSSRLFIFLGKISFSLYLVHVLVINSLMSWLFLQLSQYYSYSLAFLVSALGSLMIIFPLGYLLYRFVEQPSTFLSRRILSWLQVK